MPLRRGCSMTEEKTPDPLDDFGARLQKARARAVPERGTGGLGRNGEGNLLGIAFRFGVELVSALAVGAGIGYLLDRWLETTPLFLVVFFFLGAAAGMLNVWRTAVSLGLGDSIPTDKASSSEDDGRPD